MTDATEHEPDTLVYHDDYRNQIVISQPEAGAYSEVRLTTTQRDVLVAALSNPHTARAILRPEDILAIGQNLYAIYVQQVADNMNEGDVLKC